MAEIGYFGASIGLQSSYLCNYKSNSDKLKKEVDMLMAARDDVEIRFAERDGEEIEKDVERWLRNVEVLVVESRKIIEAFEHQAENRCFKGLCPDLKSRYQLNKEAVRKLKAVVGLRKEGKFNRLSYPILKRSIWPTYSKDFETFESRVSTLNDIYEALYNPDVNMIGVYGMAGIGKTTLVRQLAAQVKQSRLFDAVVRVEVTQTPDIKRIQGKIAVQLGLMFREENENVRASRLYDRLKREKILVILEDIWTSLDLERVGIPIEDDQRSFRIELEYGRRSFEDHHSSCKVLLTSRNHHVLSSKMGSQNNFFVGVLNEEEAFSLFKKIAADSIENFELQSLAIDIVKACGGLPIAIATIARTLRGKGISAWENALQYLISPSLSNFTGMLEEVYATIKLSYDYLKGEELKSTFVLCGLMKYSNDAPIVDLLKYGIGLGLFEGISTLEETRDKVYSLVHELKRSSLLLDGHNSEWFSIHDIVRHLVLSYASRCQHVFTLRNDDTPKDWLNRDTLKGCNAIFVHDSNISEFPEGLEYPKLEFFYMKAKYSIFKIPDNFFTGMTKLSVLSLTKLHLLTLPSSLHLLVNLRTLCLDQCIVGDIAGIGDLKKLEILSLLCLDIEQLPKEIGQLSQLRFLDLSNCSKLKVISPNVISSLSRLEALYMGNSFIEWDFGLNTVSNASLHELKHLSLLTALEIHIQDARILPVSLFSKKLKRYKIFIGDEWDWYDKFEYKRTLKLKLNTIIGLENRIIKQLKEIEGLYLDEVQGVKNVLSDLNPDGFLQLKHLYVQNSPYILCIVDLKESLPWDAFPLLESLFLRNLINLEKICHGQLTAVSFYKLRMIKVRNCDKLRNILSFSILRGLPQLQTIELINCKSMEEIFANGRENDVNYSEVIDEIEFGQLRYLTLKFLPQLTSFYYKLNTRLGMQKRPNIVTTDRWSNAISEDELVTHVPFFNGQVLCPNLKALELCAINCGKIWHHQLAAFPSCFQNLTRLIVQGCDKLKYLFSSSFAECFVQLQHLEICNCLVLEEIVAEEHRAVATTRFIFPCITFLKLWDLSELRTFYPGRHTSEWPSLKRLEFSGCDKVNIFSSEEDFSFQEITEEAQFNIAQHQTLFLVEKVGTNLEELKLSGKDFAMICQNQFLEPVFHKLKILEVVNDDSAVFQLGFLRRLCNLEKLELRSCSYREIFSYGEVVRYAIMITHIKKLKLWKLSDLKYMWKQEFAPDFILQNLEVLEVWWCDSLINLVPSSVSFQNLTMLELWYCRGLKTLLAPSTAKSLVQLLKMSIDGCEMMTEIIASEGVVAENEIIFRKLKCLSLDNLENLTSFCSGNYTFKFPSLEVLFVIECPTMTIFTPGALHVPRLQEVRQNPGLEKGYWDGDLNTTIQRLHEKKDAQSSEED